MIEGGVRRLKEAEVIIETAPHHIEAKRHFDHDSVVLVELLQRPVQQRSQTSVITSVITGLVRHTQLSENFWLQTLTITQRDKRETSA